MYKEIKENGIFVCKSLRLLNYLVRNGFNCIKARPDRENSRFIVFIFDDCRELRNCLDRYDKNLHKKEVEL